MFPSLYGVVSQGGVTWTPKDIPGIKFWLDASDIDTLWQDSARVVPVTANDDPVGGVTDLSGNGNHTGQIISASRPLYKSADNGIKFDGIDDYFERSSFMTSYPMIVFWVQSGADSPVISEAIKGDTNGMTICSASDTLTRVSTQRPVYNAISVNGAPATTPAVGVGEFRAESEKTVWYNTKQGAVSTYAAPWQASNTFWIGVSRIPFSWWSAATVREIIVYDQLVSASDREQLTAYLMGKWGIS